MSRGSRGRRYEEPKLNMKKVFAVILAIIVIIMVIFIIKGVLTKNKEQGKIASKDYFAAFKDNKWGVIDETGSVIIDPSYSEMIIVPNSKNDVFLCTYDVDYTTGTYKTKALNSKNEEIFKDYDKIEAIQNKDEKDNLWYEDDVLKVEKNGKYGIIDLSGKELLSCEYNQISALSGIKNALKILKDGKYGIVDDEGKVILKTEYADITNLGKDNKSGYIVKNTEGKYGIVDFSGNIILDMKYDEIAKVYGNDYYVVKKSGKQILVKKDGTEILTTGFDEITEILKNIDNGIIYKKDNKYGVMKTTGEVTIEASYEYLSEAKSGVFIAKKDGKYGVIDLQKDIKVELKYNSIYYNEKADIYIAEDAEFNNDIIDNTYTVKLTGILLDIDTEKGYIEIRQDEEHKYYNFKSHTLFISKKKGKYGFVDKDGKVIVDYIYDDATQQNTYGYVAVKKDGKWGAIDQKGNVVQEPTYELEDYLKVDFIGRWHLGKDINMNYYNQL